MNVQDKDFQGGASGKIAVEELASIMREREKTKRLLIGAACLFVIVAALVMVFAPAGKENLGYILGAALVVMALGAIGATQFRIKLPGDIDIDTHTTNAGADVHVPQSEPFSKDNLPPPA